jgi:hypothetical protein
MDDAFINKDN